MWMCKAEEQREPEKEMWSRKQDQIDITLLTFKMEKWRYEPRNAMASISSKRQRNGLSPEPSESNAASRPVGKTFANEIDVDSNL